MKFVDQALIKVEGGKGGDGLVSFRREKYMPMGGPDGGDGGRGGSVILKAVEGMSTLYDVRYKKHVKGLSGQKGQGNDKFGRKGKDMTLNVPVGTLVYDNSTGELLADLVEHGQNVVVAHGGDGGKGNAKYRTSVRKAPNFAQDGFPGELRTIRLELKLIADVGILGFPSVGKSTLISVVSNARPKIAEYHFTTLVPNLGMVENENFIPYVIADIPGIIEGASEGAGLGHRFLRHVERTKFLIHMVSIAPDRVSPVEDIKALNRELGLFSSELAGREQIYVLNKVDSYYTDEDEEKIADLREFLGDKPLFEISAVARQGVAELMKFVGKKVIEYQDRGSE